MAYVTLLLLWNTLIGICGQPDDDECVYPFHPWCFGVYTQVSKFRHGRVLLNQLAAIMDNADYTWDSFSDYSDPAVREGAANGGITIPGMNGSSRTRITFPDFGTP